MNLPPVDKEGFLVDLEQWSPEVASALASEDGIELSEAHWSVITTARNYYHRYQLSPITRVLVKAVRDDHGEALGNSIRLMQLFNAKPARLANKIAGLPKPSNCD